MSDILERLENYIPGENDDCVAERIAEAVAEIERLRRKLMEIHEISQEHNLPAWQVIENIAATAASALSPKEKP